MRQAQRGHAADPRAGPRTDRINLMAMQKEKRPEREGLVHHDAGKERGERARVDAPVLVVVAPDLEVAGSGRVGGVEAAKQVVDGGMGDVDLLEGVVLPELLGVAQLDVGETLRIAKQPSQIEKAYELIQEGLSKLTQELAVIS